MTPISKLGQRVSRRLRWESYRLSLWWNDVGITRWHDMMQGRRLRVLAGGVPLEAKLAVLAIYPKGGVLPSHVATLRHLLARGYAPLVISNLPLSDDDIARLRPLCWQMIQRPNFGFDIGGYRAALTWLGPRLKTLDRLVLTNDSIWFPVGPARDWLTVADDLCAAGAAVAPDLIGAVSNGGMARAGNAGAWQVRGDDAAFHYCSFALSFGPRILRDPDFLPFWLRMRLTDEKVEIVKRGEIAISRWALSRGHSHAACWDLAGLEQRLSAQSLDVLVPLVDALIMPEDPPLRARRDAFRQSEQVRNHAAVVQFLMTAIAETGPAYALPAWTLREDGFGFLKKSPLRLEAGSRAETLAVLADEPQLLAEAGAVPGPSSGS